MRDASAPNDPNQLTTMPRAAKARRIGVKQLRKAARAGELPIYPIGSWQRVKLDDVDRWLESKRVGA